MQSEEIIVSPWSDSPNCIHLSQSAAIRRNLSQSAAIRRNLSQSAAIRRNRSPLT
jgi:hypothetical protein